MTTDIREINRAIRNARVQPVNYSALLRAAIETGHRNGR